MGDIQRELRNFSGKEIFQVNHLYSLFRLKRSFHLHIVYATVKEQKWYVVYTMVHFSEHFGNKILKTNVRAPM